MIVSASKIATFQDCPLRYHWIYNLKLITIKGRALELWSKYHEIVRQYHIDWDEHEFKIWEEYDLLRWYLKKPIYWDIIETEKRVQFAVPWTDVECIVIIDRMDTDKTIDYKTTSVDYKEEDWKNIQSLLYTYWRWLEEWIIYPFFFHIVNKKKVHQKKYKPQILWPIIYTEEELNEVPNIINKFVKDSQWPTYECKPSSKCWWCPFWPIWLGMCKCQYQMYKKSKKK